jgi:hypothetical protein
LQFLDAVNEFRAEAIVILVEVLEQVTANGGKLSAPIEKWQSSWVFERSGAAFDWGEVANNLIVADGPTFAELTHWVEIKIRGFNWAWQVDWIGNCFSLKIGSLQREEWWRFMC